MAILLILLVAVISRNLLQRPEPKAKPASIAVLPFVNMSADAEKEYFSDGMTEELINALAKVKGLNVVARTSVFQFKGKAYDIRKVGEQLNVSTVLEGSVRRAGEKMRITVQLISAAALKALALNDNLAEAHSSLAYAKMLHEWDWPTAEREFKRALELNPNYATAYQWYAEYLAAQDRFNEALVAIERVAGAQRGGRFTLSGVGPNRKSFGLSRMARFEQFRIAAVYRTRRCSAGR
jgi:TolB-like protein